VGLFVHMDHIASSNQYISAPEYDNFDGFLDEKCLKNTNISTFAKFPGIPMGIRKKPNFRKFLGIPERPSGIPDGPAYHLTEY